jgi:hypothetical protein
MSALQTFDSIIDIHAHADPDKTRRAIDVLELAKMYQDRGFRGFVIMNHFDPTAGLAYLARKHAPGLEVFGGIVLNRLVGGINPAAVEHFIRVYMPTLDSENEVRHNQSSSPYVRISEDGHLLPEVLDMLDLIARHKLVLSTGHSSPQEILLLTQAAVERGVEQILATNPTFPSIDMSVEQMVKAARLGAYIELIYYVVGMPGWPMTMKDYADAVKAIGPEHCILSSCGGQAWMPIHTFAWTELLNGMREHGLTENEIDLMAKVNPVRLLGLE